MDGDYFIGSEARFNFSHELIAFDTNCGYRTNSPEINFLVGREVEKPHLISTTGS